MKKERCAMAKFRLPRKTKKSLKYFRTDISKKNWRQWYKKYCSWKKYIKKQTFLYYSYSQEGYNHFKADRNINFICECCGRSIFKYGEYPEHPEDKEYDLLCEDCYTDKYRETCPVCEECYMKDEFTEYFFISKATTREVHMPIGMYKILKYPFYYGDCVTGFDAFFDDSLKKVSDLDIGKASELRGYSKSDILLDCICPNCLEKYSQKENFASINKGYALFSPKHSSYFSDSTPESIRRGRLNLIHQKINFAGYLQKINN